MFRPSEKFDYIFGSIESLKQSLTLITVTIPVLFAFVDSRNEVRSTKLVEKFEEKFKLTDEKMKLTDEKMKLTDEKMKIMEKKTDIMFITTTIIATITLLKQF